jgi:hypothetical protein
MIHRFARDESGMTMALAIMMVLLIGVMGVGLLTFVQNDIKSVIEANKGQRAFNIADAGVQAAKAHLRVDSFREHYDTESANDCLVGWRIGNTNWSKDDESWTSVLNPGRCDGLEDSVLAANPADDADTPWPEQYGFTTCFPDSDCNAPGTGRFHVTIECYDGQVAGDPNDPANFAPSACVGGVPEDPPDDVDASTRKFFKITSTGYDTAAGDGAVRKIEAIITTEKRSYAPIAYWTPGSIDLSGTKCISRMSFFSGGNITNAISGQGCAPTGTPSGIVADRSQPALYGNWVKSPYNTTPRVNAGGGSVTSAGFGAVGLVCGSSQCTSASNSIADGYQDYDSTTGTKGQNKTFVAHAPNPTPGGQITFPFEEGDGLEEPSEIVDPELIEEMANAADDQGNYIPASGTLTVNTADWPAAEGNESVIYFVDGNPNVDVVFKVDTGGKDAPLAKGVIVVRNGNFEFNNKSNGFEGVIIIIGNGTTTGLYDQKGGIQLDGYTAASGDMKIAGNVAPSTTIDFTNLNSFFDVSVWSWREVYE